MSSRPKEKSFQWYNLYSSSNDFQIGSILNISILHSVLNSFVFLLLLFNFIQERNNERKRMFDIKFANTKTGNKPKIQLSIYTFV